LQLGQKTKRERGILIGRSIHFQTAAIIFVSEKHDLQGLYEHESDCGSCQWYTECIELHGEYTRELGIRLENTADPTRMAEELFTKVKAMI